MRQTAQQKPLHIQKVAQIDTQRIKYFDRDENEAEKERARNRLKLDMEEDLLNVSDYNQRLLKLARKWDCSVNFHQGKEEFLSLLCYTEILRVLTDCRNASLDGVWKKVRKPFEHTAIKLKPRHSFTASIDDEMQEDDVDEKERINHFIKIKK